MGTNADSIESVAEEVNALKFALGLLALRLSDSEKNKFLIELTQLDDPCLQKLASEIKQFSLGDINGRSLSGVSL
ncbi:hypothetical protein EBP34_24695 [Salmonella enterica subsp. enterica serovar Saintpaul]|nr:hypothetical protein [Salmonella enterica subsp. enterica serovar Saintpaul]